MVCGGHHILIHRDARLPAEAQQIFTTLHDGQDTVRDTGLQRLPAGQGTEVFIEIDPLVRALVDPGAHSWQCAAQAHLVLLEGENALSAKILGEFSLADIPAAAKGAPRILVSFRISRSGLLTVHAKDLDGPSAAEWRQIDALRNPSLQTSAS